MSNIIEAMARAHWEAEYSNRAWKRMTIAERKRCISFIRAAIRAAMECEPPIVAGKRKALSDDPAIAREEWRALLAAMLEETHE